jgi:hypothetical protein
VSSPTGCSAFAAPTRALGRSDDLTAIAFITLPRQCANSCAICSKGSAHSPSRSCRTSRIPGYQGVSSRPRSQCHPRRNSGNPDTRNRFRNSVLEAAAWPAPSHVPACRRRGHLRLRGSLTSPPAPCYRAATRAATPALLRRRRSPSRHLMSLRPAHLPRLEGFRK